MIVSEGELYEYEDQNFRDIWGKIDVSGKVVSLDHF